MCTMEGEVLLQLENGLLFVKEEIGTQTMVWEKLVIEKLGSKIYFLVGEDDDKSFSLDEDVFEEDLKGRKLTGRLALEYIVKEAKFYDLVLDSDTEGLINYFKKRDLKYIYQLCSLKSALMLADNFHKQKEHKVLIPYLFN